MPVRTERPGTIFRCEMDVSKSAAFFNPHGQRTGGYQEGKDHVIVNSNSQSYVSYADYAIAVLDELEQPKHIHERYTVVSEAE